MDQKLSFIAMIQTCFYSALKRNGSAVKIEIGMAPERVISTKFPKEYWKTFTALCFVLCNFLLTTVSLSVTHELRRHNQTEAVACHPNPTGHSPEPDARPRRATGARLRRRPPPGHGPHARGDALGRVRHRPQAPGGAAGSFSSEKGGNTGETDSTGVSGGGGGAGCPSSSVESPGWGRASQPSSKSLAAESAGARTATAVLSATCVSFARAGGHMTAELCAHAGGCRDEFMPPLTPVPMRLAAPLQPKRLRHGEQ